MPFAGTALLIHRSLRGSKLILLSNNMSCLLKNQYGTFLLARFQSAGFPPFAGFDSLKGGSRLELSRALSP
jgi:hypothetical protein